MRRRVDNLVVLVWHGICSLPEETLLLFTKLLMSVSDSELEEELELFLDPSDGISTFGNVTSGSLGKLISFFSSSESELEDDEELDVFLDPKVGS